MSPHAPHRLALALVALAAGAAAGRAATPQALPLSTVAGLRPIGVTLEAVEHRGHRAVRVLAQPSFEGHQLVLVPGTSLRDGVIEAQLAGRPAAGAGEGARGFVGIAFRVGEDGSRFECFYLRPTNGRADDQLRRNHSTQYIAHPGFPWQKLREESPGVYESYVDLVPGEWTAVRIEVEGRKARLFVGGATQPTLLVNDLKLGEGTGAVALWVGDGTEAWFRDLTVTPR